MNCVSGGASKNLLIKQKEVVLSIEHIMPGLLYACSYDNEWYFGVANYILVENYIYISYFIDLYGIPPDILTKQNKS